MRDKNIEPKSTVEILTEFAVRSNRKIFLSEIPYPSTPINPVILHKRTLCIVDKEEELFIVGYSDPKSLSKNNLFFGSFFKIPFPLDRNLRIRKKNIFDKLNPFIEQKVFKTGNCKFDSSVVMSGNDEILLKNIFTNVLMQNTLLDLFEMDNCLICSMNEVDLNFVPFLENSSNIGIYTKQEWIVEDEKIENLFSKVQKIRKLIMEYCDRSAQV